MSDRKRILIDAPSEMTVLAARHLDATEGPVQVGQTVDTAARSAITTVLRYIATAHNTSVLPASTAPAADSHPIVKGRCPACRGSSLFLGSGGHVTCSRLDCSNPSLADAQLHGETDQTGIGDIQLTRHLGRGLVVDKAPPRARIALTVLASAGWGGTLFNADRINIAEQVLYKVVGYDPEHASLVVELVEDWRKPGVLTFDRKLTEAEMKDIKARWQEQHGKPGTAHVVTEIHTGNPPVQCWHTEADTPCDWDVCRQPDRLAAGDRGTDPARDTRHREP